MALPFHGPPSNLGSLDKIIVDFKLFKCPNLNKASLSTMLLTFVEQKIIIFGCQEREIEPIDEIVCLLPWGLETTLSVLIGDQKKDNVQFIPPGKVKRREEERLRGLFNKSIRAYSLV